MAEKGNNCLMENFTAIDKKLGDLLQQKEKFEKAIEDDDFDFQEYESFNNLPEDEDRVLEVVPNPQKYKLFQKVVPVMEKVAQLSDGYLYHSSLDEDLRDIESTSAEIEIRVPCIALTSEHIGLPYTRAFYKMVPDILKCFDEIDVLPSDYEDELIILLYVKDMFIDKNAPSDGEMGKNES